MKIHNFNNFDASRLSKEKFGALSAGLLEILSQHPQYKQHLDLNLLVEKFIEQNAKFAVTVNVQKKSDLTTSIQKLDELRDLHSYEILREVKNGLKSNKENIRQAAQALYKILEPHGTFYAKPQDVQSVEIVSIATKINQSEVLCLALKTLKLEEDFKSMIDFNKQISELITQRIHEKGEKADLQEQGARIYLKTLYKHICNYICMLADLNADSYSQDIFTDINNLQIKFRSLLSSNTTQTRPTETANI